MFKLKIILSLICVSCYSADLHLFDTQGKFNDLFAVNILNGDLKTNDKVFVENKSFIYKEILGSGNTTLVLRVLDDNTGKEFALRLPHGNQELNYTISDGKRFLNHTYNGFTKLDKANLPIPKIHAYSKDSYMLVDIVEHDFTLKSLLAKHESYDQGLKSAALDSLYVFAKQSAQFTSIGDFPLDDKTTIQL